jgi:hypothetical protein
MANHITTSPGNGMLSPKKWRNSRSRILPACLCVAGIESVTVIAVDGAVVTKQTPPDCPPNFQFAFGAVTDLPVYVVVTECQGGVDQGQAVKIKTSFGPFGRECVPGLDVDCNAPGVQRLKLGNQVANIVGASQAGNQVTRQEARAMLYPLVHDVQRRLCIDPTLWVTAGPGSSRGAPLPASPPMPCCISAPDAAGARPAAAGAPPRITSFSSWGSSLPTRALH